jgi:transcriptional regulator with XRE-family HTH domain
MLAVKLSQVMEEKGLSPRQVAKEVGVSHTTILRAVRGDIVDVKTIIQLSEWLAIKPATLLNSMVTTDMGLPDQIAVLLAGYPLLEKEFAAAIEAVVSGKVAPVIIADIAAYAAYRIKLSSSHP